MPLARSFKQTNLKRLKSMSPEHNARSEYSLGRISDRQNLTGKNPNVTLKSKPIQPGTGAIAKRINVMIRK